MPHSAYLLIVLKIKSKQTRAGCHSIGRDAKLPTENTLDAYLLINDDANHPMLVARSKTAKEETENKLNHFSVWHANANRVTEAR